MQHSVSKSNLLGKIVTILLVSVLAGGILLLLYPTVSDWWNSFHQTQVISTYQESVAELDKSSYEEVLQEAITYNEQLVGDNDRFVLSDEELADYERQLDIGGSGIMGYLEIPRIDVELPVYHGTDAAVLQVAVGHIEGSSLPVGGENTHCVISGHRGLPSARLLTDLDQMEIGDRFMLHTLDEVLTYEVDAIHIVEPEDLSYLSIEEGQDLCTLVTCTPYGVNSHRLLVRGHRVESDSVDEIRVPADAVQIETTVVTMSIVIPLLVIILLVVLVMPVKKHKK